MCGSISPKRGGPGKSGRCCAVDRLVGDGGVGSEGALHRGAAWCPAAVGKNAVRCRLECERSRGLTGLGLKSRRPEVFEISRPVRGSRIVASRREISARLASSAADRKESLRRSRSRSSINGLGGPPSPSKPPSPRDAVLPSQGRPSPPRDDVGQSPPRDGWLPSQGETSPRKKCLIAASVRRLGPADLRFSPPPSQRGGPAASERRRLVAFARRDISAKCLVAPSARQLALVGLVRSSPRWGGVREQSSKRMPPAATGVALARVWPTVAIRREGTDLHLMPCERVA